MTGADNLHAGHRQRMKQRFLENGERAFDDHQLLEILLYYAVPRADTNELAHLLIRQFGSLAGVFNADPAELCKVKGMGGHAAFLIHLMPELMRRYQRSAAEPEKLVSTIDDAAAYLRPYFFGLRKEQIYLLSVDHKDRVVGCDFLGEGSDLSVGLDARLMTEVALRHRAAWVMLAHSHPSGVAIPSGSDVITTRNCYKLLKALEIELRDHLIFADDDYVSMRQSNLLY